MGADTRHVRGCLRRIASVALAAFALACLSGCGGGPGGPSGGGFFSGATSLFGGSTKIAVAPIIGTTPQVAQELTDALVVAGKDRDLTLLPDGGNANYTLRGYLVASSERQGLEDLLYLGRQRRGRPARGAGVRRRGRRRPVGGRSLEQRRQCGHPQHRRQDHLATRRQPATGRRLGQLGGGRFGRSPCRDGLDGFDPLPQGSEPQGRRRARSTRVGCARRRPKVADDRLEEAPLCRRR